MIDYALLIVWGILFRANLAFFVVPHARGARLAFRIVLQARCKAVSPHRAVLAAVAAGACRAVGAVGAIRAVAVAHDVSGVFLAGL